MLISTLFERCFGRSRRWIGLSFVVTFVMFWLIDTPPTLAEKPSQTDVAASQAIPADSRLLKQLSTDDLRVFESSDGQRLWLAPGESVLADKRLTLPRGHAPMRSMGWKGHFDHALKFTPEPDRWVFSWKHAPADHPLIEVVFDHPVSFAPTPPSAQPADDGSVMLHAFQAQTYGEKLRFEPQWYKNTVGYWTVPSDYAEWEAMIVTPGTYSVAVLQGCGVGQGGSDAVMTLHRDDTVKVELPFQTIDTGHFQNFRWHPLGLVTIDEAGSYRLRITPKRIAKAALFDVRAIHLVRQAKAP